MQRFEQVAPDLPDVAAIIETHFVLMRGQTPPESCHALPAAALEAPDIRLFALREGGKAVAIGALRIDGAHGELKSMHTLQACRGRGLGRRLLDGVMNEARALGVSRLFLETGSGPEHAAARRLYTSAGFEVCPPFARYKADPASCFMTRAL